MNESMKKTLLIAIGISTVLLLFVVLEHNLSFQKSGTIVLPAGGTYLGSTPTPQAPAAAISAPVNGMVAVKGRIYPYAFEIPATLRLVTFPNDTYDIYALAIEGAPPEQNVLIGVDDLNRTEGLKKFIKGSKKAYVESWWKQFSGLTGVASLTSFTNSKGLIGYRAKFKNANGQAPNEDVFLESPDGRYVIHVANGPLEKPAFDAIVDSVGWTK